MNKPKSVLLYPLLLLVLVVLAGLNLVFGSVSISLNELYDILAGKEGFNPAHATIVFHFRLPQLITAALTGAALAVAGLLLQTLFRNPLADPSILGISSGASLGVALLIFGVAAISGTAYRFTVFGPVGLVAASFAGALAVLSLITIISRMLSSMTSLLIAGLMIAYLAGALTGIVKYFSSREDLQAFVVWGMGSFSNVSADDLKIFVPGVSLGLVLVVFLVKPLNQFLLGESYAANLGLRIRAFRTFVLILAGYLTAVTTAYTGPVAFVGLAVPHLARNLFKTSNHALLLPSSLLLGASLALLCNLIARLPGFDGSLPINSITSLLGAPVVIYVLIKRYRSMPAGL